MTYSRAAVDLQRYTAALGRCLTMQSSIGDHKNFELDSEFDGEPVKSNQNRCHIRPFGEPSQEFSSSILDHSTFPSLLETQWT